MNWHEGLTAWQEILFGLGLLVLGLYLEDRIDRWRARKREQRETQRYRVVLRSLRLPKTPKEPKR